MTHVSDFSILYYRHKNTYHSFQSPLFSRSQTHDCGPTFIPASIPMLRNRSTRRDGRKRENGTASEKGTVSENETVSEKGTEIGTENVKEIGRQKMKGHAIKTLPLKRKARKV